MDREGFVAFSIVLYIYSVDMLLEIGLAVLRTDWGLRESRKRDHDRAKKRSSP